MNNGSMENALVFIKENHPVADSQKENHSFDKFPLALGCSSFGTPNASNLSIVFDNAAFEGDSIGSELASTEDRSCEYWDKQRLSQDNVMVQMDWNVSDSPAEKHTPPALVSKNLVVILHHALKQGLTFKLQGVGLGDMLGQTAKSTRLLLASSRLANFVKGGKGHCNTGCKRQSLNRGSKLAVKDLENSDAINREVQITSPGCLVDVLDENEMHMTAQHHSSLMPCSEPYREVSVCKNERSLLPCPANSESLSFEDREIQWHSAPSRMPAPSLSSRSIASDRASEALGPVKTCQHHVDAEVASKQFFSEINPGHAGDDQLSGHTIPPQHENNRELKDTMSTIEMNSKYAEFIQDTPRYTHQFRPDNFEGKATCKVSHMHSSYFQPKIEQSLPKCNFNTRPGSEPNFYPSDQFPNAHGEWLEQSAKLQVPTEPSTWPKQNFMERNVKAGFSDLCLPETLQHFWSHSPACRYQYTPEKFFKYHCDNSTCRFNPLVQSCPSFAQPLLHSQCQQTHGRCHPNSSHLMVFPEEGKPLRPFAAALCSTCLPSREHFPGSAPVCQAQNDNVMQSYQCPSPALNDFFQCPSEFYPGPSTLEHVQLDNCRGPPSKLKPKKLLWLSEEEAEIIRLIRLSQVKDLSRCSSSYHASEQASPVLSARTGHDIQEEVNLNEARDASHFSSRVSSSSMDDFASKAAEAGALNLGYMDTNCMTPPEEDQPFSMDGDCTKLVSDEKQTNKQDAGHKDRAASCIQYFWRKHIERRNKDLEEQKRLEALKFIFEMPACQEHLLQMAVTAMKNGQLVSWHASIHRAAKVIQHAWQEVLRRKNERMLAPKTLPQELKEFYKLILWRHTNKGFAPPTYERFVRLMKRLQATTEGARIRRRLKSRRLQTIVKEIREIRVVLQELSGEGGLEPSLNLLPQLSMQLQQKLLQLQTALSGPQDAARVLLRRCPATPLVLCSSKTVQAEVTGLQSQSVVGDAGSLVYPLAKSSKEIFTSSQKSGVMSQSLGKPLTESFTGSQKSKHQTQPRISNFSDADVHGNYHSSMESELQPPSLPRSRVVQSKSNGFEVQLVPTEEKIETSRNRSIYESKVQVEKQSVRGRSLDPSVNKGSRESSAISKSEHAVEQWQNSTFLSFPEKASDISSVKSSSVNMEDSDYEDMSQSLDVPKHPFLRRKSKAMPPQKLDWSKVKPMVSSRLEPELKNRLLKAKFRGTALFRKRNFSQIKSRLFSYEKSGLEEDHDIVKDSQLRHDGAETKGGSQKEYAKVELGVPNKSSCNAKVHRSKQPSLRYLPNEGLCIKDGTKEIAEAESEHNLLACSSRKLRGKKTDKNPEVSLFDPACESDEFVAFENQPRSQGHSRRYGSPKKSSDPGGFERCSNVPTNYENSQPGKRADLLFSNNVKQPLSELEKMFDDVIVRQGREVSLAAYFGSNQQDSIVPRLYPNSNVFETSRHKMSHIHQLLSKEGCAGRLQHNCLSFVSIRD